MSYQPGPLQKIRDVKVGEGTSIGDFVNLYECSIGAFSQIGDYVEIGKNVQVGKRCKIGNHTYICPGVVIEDDVVIGDGVTFINDRFPKATNAFGSLQTENDWKVHPTLIKRGATICSRAVIMCDITIGEVALVGAGSVVTRDLANGEIVAGNPKGAEGQLRVIRSNSRERE